MSRLSDSVRDDVIRAVTESVRAVIRDDGYVDVELLAKQRSELVSKRFKLPKIAKERADGVPGIDLFFVVETFRYTKHVEDRSLQEFVAKRLEQLRVEFVEKAETAFGDEAHDVAEALGDAEMFDERYVDNWMAEHFRKEPNLPPSTPAPAPGVLAEAIVSQFESWPRLYDFLVELPFPREIFDTVFDGRYALSDSVRVEVLTDHDRMLLGEPDLKRQWYVLRAAIQGYDLVGQEDDLGRMESVTRQFLGLAIAVGLIDVGWLKWGHTVMELSAEIGPISASEFAASGFKLPERLNSAPDELSPDDSAVIGALALPLKYGAGLNLSENDTALRLRNNPAWTEDAPRFRQALHEIAFAFRSNDLRLLSAGEWLFGSYAGTNQALQMVQAITVFETLYGRTREEKGRKKSEADDLGAVSLGALLATRTSYALATRPSEREEIFSDFKKLYDERCEIVHTGQRRLNDETKLPQARNLAKRSIKRELHFMGLQEPTA